MREFLFVCVHNAGRSQMAEAFVNHYAKLNGLPVKGASAGTIGGKTLNPMVIQAMEEFGISMAGQSPKLLTKEMLGPETTAITMGCGVDADACPTKFLAAEDWGLDDPAGKGIEAVRAIRNEIDLRVRALLGVD